MLKKTDAGRPRANISYCYHRLTIVKYGFITSVFQLTDISFKEKCQIFPQNYVTSVKVSPKL